LPLAGVTLIFFQSQQPPVFAPIFSPPVFAARYAPTARAADAALSRRQPLPRRYAAALRVAFATFSVPPALPVAHCHAADD